MIEQIYFPVSVPTNLSGIKIILWILFVGFILYLLYRMFDSFLEEKKKRFEQKN